MLKLRWLGTGLLGLFAAQSFAATPDWLTANIHHQTQYDSLRDRLDVNYSDLQLIFAQDPINIPDYLVRYQAPDGHEQALDGWKIELSSRLSAAPSLLKNRAEDDVRDRADEEIGLAEPLIRQQVAFYLSQDPGFLALDPAVQAMVLDQQAAAAVEGVRAEAYDLISERIDEIQTETSIQELAITAAKPLAGGDKLVFFRIGKYKPQFGPSLNNSLRTELEALRPVSSRTQRMTSTVATGAVGGGLVSRGDGYSLRAEMALFHDRIPWISAEDYIANVVRMDENSYDEHKKIGRLDSGAIRFNLQVPGGEGYLSVGSYDQDAAWSVGAIIRVSPRDRLFIDFSDGDRDYLERGYSVAYAHDFDGLGRKLSLYLGYEHLDQAAIRAEYNDLVDLDEAYTGAKLNLWSGALLGQQSLLDIGAEVVHQDLEAGSIDETDWGVRASAHFQMHLD